MWSSAKPDERTWTNKEIFFFLREIHSRFKFGTVTWDAPSVGAATTVDTVLTDDVFTGLRVGMPIFVSPPATIDTGIVSTARCDVNNQLTIRLMNVTAAPINPASGDWSFMGVML